MGYRVLGPKIRLGRHGRVREVPAVQVAFGEAHLSRVEVVVPVLGHHVQRAVGREPVAEVPQELLREATDLAEPPQREDVAGRHAARVARRGEREVLAAVGLARVDLPAERVCLFFRCYCLLFFCESDTRCVVLQYRVLHEE